MCPNDELWTARDEQASEDEVAEFLYGLIRLIKPSFVVETGCYLGDATIAMAKALKKNEHGHLTSCDIDKEKVEEVRKRLKLEGLENEVMVVTMPGDEMIRTHGSPIQFAFIDSGGGEGVREKEVEELLFRLPALSMFAMHDTSPNHKHIHDVADRVDLPKVYFNTPRGLTLFMKK